MRLLTRSIRPPDEIEPNPNDPASVPPATVGPPAYEPGDPHGLLFDSSGELVPPPPRVPSPMPWSGWPLDWATSWGHVQTLTDTAWTCLDLNASLLAAMPPYLVGASPHLDADWLTNPDPSVYTSWEEFAKQLFWDYQAVGEVFVIATARYATGYPARFHVVPPWYIEAEIGDDGLRHYYVGRVEVTADVLHVRYTSRVGDAHGHGPLEVGATRLVAAEILNRYAVNLVNAGGIPPSILTHPDELSAQQADDLRTQWVIARQSALGEPAVLTGGVTWEPTTVNPQEMALVELTQHNEGRIAIMLGVPPFLVGLPSGGDSMTYSNTTAVFDYHWRAGLRPKATMVTAALSEWLLPRGTTVEVNRDAYIQPPPAERAQTAATLNAIRDEAGNPALSVEEIRKAERLDTRVASIPGGPIA